MTVSLNVDNVFDEDPPQCRRNGQPNFSGIALTDGAFMTASSCVNLSWTYMAFTARACDYAVKQLQAGIPVVQVPIQSA